MRFRDRRHQLAVQAAERNDPVAQAVIAEFCNLINFPYQQQQGLFAVGFYNAVIPAATPRGHAERDAREAGEAKKDAAAQAADAAPLAASTDDVADSEAMAAVDAAAAAPALHAEEPIFAEGTEGIIAAAEQLSDDQLDAGGDAAVASAAAGPADAAPAEHSSNGTGEDSEETTRPESLLVEPPHVEAEQPEQSQPEQSQPEQSPPGAPQADQGTRDDLDLSSLLDPYLEHDNGNPEAGGNGDAQDAWRDSLSLDDVPAHDEPVPVKDVALEGESADDRNHVSQ
jgi:hypothetical protein